MFSKYRRTILGSFLCAIMMMSMNASHVMAGAHKRQTIIQLHPGMVIGKSVFPNGDTKNGGQGQHVNGIQADIGAQIIYHVHAHLSLFHDGQQIAVPQEIGILHLHMKSPAGKLIPITAYYWLHTHDRSGIIHVESPLSPAHVQFTLGSFFDIWGEPLSSKQVTAWRGNVTVFVNGKLYRKNPRLIRLLPHEEITLEVGKPVVPPPTYRFPPGF